MADALVKHAFVPTIPEGTDPTKIRTSNWNAPLLFSAGSDGEILTRSAASATGAAWSAGPLTLSGLVLSASVDPAVANLSFTDGVPPYVIAPATGHDNLFIGLNTGGANTTGSGNLGIGHSAAASVTTGNLNAALGWDALMDLTTGDNNTALGVDAFRELISGSNNTGVGYTAGMFNQGSRNVAIGPNSLYAAAAGSYNVAIGYGSMNLITSDGNVGVGYQTLGFTVGGEQNTALGYAAGNHALGSRNVFLGYAAGYYETGADKLFIDNQVRASEADARLKALVYGGFAATVAGQSLTVNGVLKPYQVQVDGTNAVPGYSFASDPDTGLRWAVSGQIQVVSNGVDGPTFDGSGFNITGAGRFRSATYGTKIQMPADGQINLLTNGSTGVGLDVATASVLKVRTSAQTGYATVDALGYSVGGAAGASKAAGPVTSITVVNGIVTAIS